MGITKKTDDCATLEEDKKRMIVQQSFFSSAYSPSFMVAYNILSKEEKEAIESDNEYISRAAKERAATPASKISRNISTKMAEIVADILCCEEHLYDANKQAFILICEDCRKIIEHIENEIAREIK